MASVTADAPWVAGHRRWTLGWRRSLLAATFLVYLVFVGEAVADHADGAKAFVGYLVLCSFAAGYLATVVQVRDASPRHFRAVYAWLLALAVVELLIAHETAFIMCSYLGVIAIGRFGLRGAPVVAGYTLAAFVVPTLAWGLSWATAIDNATGIAIPVVGFVAFVMLQVIEGNRELADARAELARLTAENERARIARDLHDLLGHSLTTITVKAALARKLGEVDPAAGFREIAEVETLARRSLADVRATVSGYRQVTLTGELASGREVLRAAGVDADLPRSGDVVAPELHELFGWVLREGLTNVVRHAAARTCEVRLGARAIEILDDGAGSAAAAGNGLTGLRERVAAVGGVVQSGPREPRGWRVHVTVPA